MVAFGVRMKRVYVQNHATNSLMSLPRTETESIDVKFPKGQETLVQSPRCGGVGTARRRMPIQNITTNR